jgi:shikimate dehydrogenase
MERDTPILERNTTERWCEIAPVTGESKIIAVLGWPVGHLRTPTFFNAMCVDRGYKVIMIPWAVQPDDLRAAWDGLRNVQNLSGLVVAIPHKQSAASLCDKLEGDALPLQVVNAVRRNADGSFTGRIYDGVAFVDGLLRDGIALTDRRVLLVGAGGAASAIALAMARQGVAALTVANRSAEKARCLLELLQRESPGPRFEVGKPIAAGHDLIINATSLGMNDLDPLPCDLSSLDKGAVVADVIMQPMKTRLLKLAEARGVRTHLGDRMVASQLEHFVDFLIPTPRADL